MCGIGGVLSSERGNGFQGRRAFFKDAIYTGTLRGDDSTGYFLVPKRGMGNNVLIRKKAVPGPDFLDMTKMVKPLNSFDNHSYAIFHNRAATKGLTNSSNAHPFEHGNITLVHNGTLNLFRYLTGNNGPDFSVDSEAITWAFNEYGHESVLKELDGAFALIWYDASDGILRAVRNTERPLHFATIDNEKTVLLASEAGMLNWLAPRNGLKIKEMYSISSGDIISFPREDPRLYTIKEVKLKEPTFSAYYGGNREYHYSSNNSGNHFKGDKKSKQLPSKNLQVVRKEKEIKELEKLNLKLHETVYFWCTHFTYYQKSTNYGYLEGHLMFAPASGTQVIVHSVEANNINPHNFYEGKQFKGKIVGISEDQILRLVYIEPSEDDPPRKQSKVNFDEEVPENEEEDEFEEEEDDAKSMGYSIFKKYKGPNGTFISRNEWLEKTINGCCSCQCSLLSRQHKDIKWLTEDQPLCKICQS